MDDNETKRLIATLIQVGDRANARITALEHRITALEEQAHPDDVRDALHGSGQINKGENDDGKE